MNPKDFHSQAAGKTLFTPNGFWTFIPNPLPPELSWSTGLVSALGDAERELSRLSAMVLSFPFPRLLIQPFIREEAVISSRIEGTHASLFDLFTYEAAQLSFFERADDVREVHNNVRALEFGLERLKTLPVSLRLIREVHAILTENVRGGSLTPGEFRRSQNWIGPVGSTPTSAVFVPPPIDEMNQALDHFEKFIHSDTKIPILVRIGLIHYQFEAIHPFLDGNGRVGRLLIVLLLSEWGLLTQPLLNLSTYIERYRQQYYDLLLQVSQEGDWDTWLLFFLRGVSEQAQASIIRMERLQQLRNKYQTFIEQARNPARMSGIVDFFFSRPIVSVKQVSDGLVIPKKTAQDYLDKLQQAGVIREITGYARNRLYQANEIFNALQGIERR
ncbi:MAG TPA: Fic family protein [Bellilinea sp.]|nr:Fic family protein [Bellilinea sp.]